MSDGATNFTLGSIALIGIGAAVDHKLPNMKLILSGGIVVVGISVMDNVNPKLATGFAGLIFFGIALNQLPKIVDTLGLKHGGNDIDPSKLHDAENAKPLTNTTNTPVKPPSSFVPNLQPGGTAATPQKSGGLA